VAVTIEFFSPPSGSKANARQVVEGLGNVPFEFFGSGDYMGDSWDAVWLGPGGDLMLEVHHLSEVVKSEAVEVWRETIDGATVDPHVKAQIEAILTSARVRVEVTLTGAFNDAGLLDTVFAKLFELWKGAALVENDGIYIDGSLVVDLATGD
jgi:hypothetical protein